ncbi:MAG: SDR family NAD(P)-dependent oxidoreductase [Thermoanaerobaculales bacterium]
MRRFDSKVVMITGASSGIGAALGREFAARGATVALAARRADRLQALADVITASSGKAAPFTCDVTRDGDIERTVAAVVERFGHLDIAVANAGFGVVGAFGALTLDDYRRQFETNVFGLLRTSYAVVPELKRNRGVLVLLGSVTGYLAAPRASPYAMSKFAVRAFADSVRAELTSDGVAVVLISPGFVDSEIRRVDNRGRFHANAPEPIPNWLRMPTERAARTIVGAVARRKAEKIITAHAALAVFLARHLPRVVRLLLRRGRPYRTAPRDDG